MEEIQRHAPLTQQITKSHVNKKENNSSLAKKTLTKSNAQLVYLPLSFLKNALYKVTEQIGSKKSLKNKTTVTPEKELQVKAQNRQFTNFNNFLNDKLNTVKNGMNPSFFVTEQDGKRFLVVNPNNSPMISNHMFSFPVPASKNLMAGQQSVNTFLPYAPTHAAPTHTGPFGNKGVFDDSLFDELPLSGGALKGKVFKGFVAVPILGGNVHGNFQPSAPIGLPTASSPPLPSNQGLFNSYNNNFQQLDSEATQRPQNIDGAPNTFMYGPQYGLKDDSGGDSMYEQMSMNQPLLSGHFYRDPTYDPHESETAFPETHNKNYLSHRHRHPIMTDYISPADINNPPPIQVQDQRPMFVSDTSRPLQNPFFANNGAFVDPRDQDLNKFMTPSGKIKSIDSEFGRVPEMNTPFDMNGSPQQTFHEPAEQYADYPHFNSLYQPHSSPRLYPFTNENENNNMEEANNEIMAVQGSSPVTREVQGNSPVTGEGNAAMSPDGNAPQPLPFEAKNEEIKKHTLPSVEDKPIVFTQRVGFGPITVTAKTADAPLDDPDDAK